MFGRAITLFRLFGFRVRVDLSWLVIAALITWSLAEGVFDREKFPELERWIMGAAGAVGLFVSVVLHEMCHSLVARRYGLPLVQSLWSRPIEQVAEACLRAARSF